MPINLSLSRISRLFAQLGPYTRPTIHIAGTNGKGSVSAFLSSILSQSPPLSSSLATQAHNGTSTIPIPKSEMEEKKLSVGRFNSPHLLTPRDSILINNTPISKALYTRLSSFVSSVDASLNTQCTPFELLTAIALRAFEQCEVEIVVLECGMGGRVDATNVIEWKRKVGACLTSVDEDHMKFLGGDVESIAREKMGILNGDGKPRKGLAEGAGETKLVMGRQRWRSVQDVVKTFAAEKGVEVVDAICLDRPNLLSTTASLTAKMEWRAHLPNHSLDVSGASLPLAGDHQYDNLATALTALDNLPSSLGLKLTKESVETGIQETKWRGRLERISLNVPLPNNHSTGSEPSSFTRERKVNFLLDGAHNPSSAAALASYLVLHHPSFGSFTCSPPLPAPDISLDSLPSTRSEAIRPKTRRKFILSLSHSPPKKPFQVLSPLLQRGDVVFLTPFTTPEGMPWVVPVDMEEMKKAVWNLVGQGADEGKVVVCRDAEEAMGSAAELLEEEAKVLGLEKEEGDLVVISGSLYLVADALRYQALLAAEKQRTFEDLVTRTIH